MKKIILSISLIFLLSSCTDVVNVPLDTGNPKLVIEANINWQKGTTGNNQVIKLSKTSNFYDTTVPIVSSAVVTIKNSTNVIFNFIETPNTGEYVCTNFIPQLNETYTLTIVSEGKTYTATEILQSVAPIQTITQELNSGFDGEVYQLKATYLDPANIENFYSFKYEYPEQVKPDIYVTDDIFYDGNPFYSLLFETNNDRKLKIGDQVTITHSGISKRYYEYLNILLNLAGNTGGGPFQAPPVTVRGNIINTSNQDDFPFGFFSLSETDNRIYTIQ